ncbi:MAG: hypothetical protein HY898_28955 [Deltaproteobacteria bacterium]|nr:hypothetical protein [Deltaproteobacteria bacterium]
MSDPSAGSWIAELRPNAHMTPGTSSVVAVLPIALFGLLALIALVGLLRHWMAARRERRILAPGEALAAGAATIEGELELARGAEEAVRVEITQTDVAQKGGRWKETSRKTIAKPFYLRLSQGDRVRVEPPDRVLLIDDLDEGVQAAGRKRVRTAALVAGEKVRAHGKLVQAVDPEADGTYRAAASSWVLRPKGGNMLLSTKPLGHCSRVRAWRQGIAAIVMILLAAGFELGMLDYHRLRDGQVSEAEITALRVTQGKTKKGSTSITYTAALKVLPGNPGAGLSFEDDVDGTIYAKLSQGQRVPVRVTSTATPIASIGAHATLPLHWAAMLLVALLFSTTLYGIFGFGRTGWWDGTLDEN